MKAMILAAGFGTRLKPITDSKPKALVEINGSPLLKISIQKLKNAGVNEIIINTHYLAEQINEFLKKNNYFNIRIEISNEPEILDTGGGLKKASYFFDDGQPFILHNVDIISTIRLSEMYNFHLKNNSIVTLATNQRETSRYFLFDDQNYLCGHENVSKNVKRIKRQPVGMLHRRAFCGIHVISPEIFKFMNDSEKFSIIDTYLSLIESGQSILQNPIDDLYWQDIGKIDTLDEIHRHLNNGKITIDNLL